MKARIRKASDLLAEILRTSPVGGLSSPASVASAWRSAAGDDIFEHSKVFDIANGNIIVLTSHPGWKQQILLKKRQIIERMNAGLRGIEVRNIVFKE